MAAVRMVRLLTTLDQFEARVLAARLGADGVLWEMRGGHDGPYPMGPVHVYVDAEDLPRARELLEATVELPADDPPGAGGRVDRAPLALVLVVFGIAAMAVISLARVLLS
jgi:Putative prokaryotic signal transducing protein